MSKHNTTHNTLSSSTPSSSQSSSTTNDEDEWKSIEIQQTQKTWKDNVFVPLGLLGGALALGAALVIKGKGDGRSLSQRIMEARVAAQATLLLGLVTVGYSLSKSKPAKKEEE